MTKRKPIPNSINRLTISDFVEKTFFPTYLKDVLQGDLEVLDLIEKLMQERNKKLIREIGIGKLRKLVFEAVEIRKSADPYYSKYKVGAAVLCISGKIYVGCNRETAVYTTTVHAEGNAINQAVIQGEALKRRDFLKAIVISFPAASGPCGICRQDIREYCRNALIVNVDEEGRIQGVSSLEVLLPHDFGPEHLGKD